MFQVNLYVKNCELEELKRLLEQFFARNDFDLEWVALFNGKEGIATKGNIIKGIFWNPEAYTRIFIKIIIKEKYILIRFLGDTDPRINSSSLFYSRKRQFYKIMQHLTDVLNKLDILLEVKYLDENDPKWVKKSKKLTFGYYNNAHK